jgi:PAS domain S-box-containing protein
VRTDVTTWSWRKVVSALVMGAAVPVMHYTGMAAATFVPSAAAHGDHSYAISVSSLSVTGIAVVTVMVLGMVVVTALADRRFSLQAVELEASRRHHQIIEAALDAFVGMDATGRVTDWNQQAERTFGWSRDEAIGQSLGSLIIPAQFPGARERGLGHLLAIGDGAALNKRIEIIALHRDGHQFPIELAVCPVTWGDKQLFAAFLRDVTERQQTQQALAHKVDELARSNAELEQFAYVASHDLQEPLRMVASYTQLLARRYKGRLDADADEFIGFAVDGATRMQTLIQDLLAYSRVTTRGESFEEMEATASCADALRNLRTSIADAAGVVEVTPLPRVRADATQLTQLFQNLIGNAIKYRDQRAPAIRVSARSDGPFEVFSVEDNGIGIEPQYFDRIFQMFQRLHTIKEYSGTGIGLTLCRKIVERHGGKIWVESRPGAGATFLFTMPRVERVEG